MRLRRLHRWDVTAARAISLQKRLAEKLVSRRAPGGIRLVAGADCSLDLDKGEACAAVAVFSFPALELVEEAWARRPLTFPYVPGLLTFREGPALSAAFARLRSDPDVVFFDGQGIAHPRRLGIAAHMGLILDKPSVGCGKSLLCGVFDPPGFKKGAAADLRHEGRPVGYAVRTREGCHPIFVSPGHLMDREGALALVLKCLDGYRLPKPTRWADRLAAAVKTRAAPRPPRSADFSRRA
ncbi:MAG: deoxyribonuclease V [Elusimicrobiota bacterium]